MTTQTSEKKAYMTPEVVEYGTLQQVVLNVCGTGSGDRGTVDGGSDSGWVADADVIS